MKSRLELRQYFENNNHLTVLEIGPYFNPICNFKVGNIECVDIFSQEDLIQKAINDKNITNYNDIPYINYILNESNNFKISNAIKKQYDAIISSHNLEHVPNFVETINDYLNCLKKNGYLYAYIPDCRFCFDILRGKSTIFDVLNDYYEKRKKPSFRQCLESTILHFNQNNDFYFQTSPEDIKDLKNKHERDQFELLGRLTIDELYKKTQTGYIDTHNYTFTSETLKYILDILIKYNYIEHKINYNIHNTKTNSCEFLLEIRKE